MGEIENANDECELKAWELIKTEKKIEEFIIEKGEELEQKLLRARNRFFEVLIALDKKQIKYEANKLQCDLSIKKELKQMNQKQQKQNFKPTKENPNIEEKLCLIDSVVELLVQSDGETYCSY